MKRRAEARAFSTFVDQFVTLLEPYAERQGLNLRELLDEGAVRAANEQRQLAERLQKSVLPVFVEDETGCPDRLGSCVLVRVDSNHYAFTAAHVLTRVGLSRLLFSPRQRGGGLLPFPPSIAKVTAGSQIDRDVGVVPLGPDALGAFEHCVFLTGAEIDETDREDDRTLTSFYFVLGYPASGRQAGVSRTTRLIHQKSFHCSTSPVDAAEYAEESLSRAEHVLLDFDHDDISIGGQRVAPPRLQGVSGGGVFHVSRITRQTSLVGIATENRRNSRVIVATRLKHFLSMARSMAS
jgi:hypothetical protein